jgi:PAS domain S-box-containing protein
MNDFEHPGILVVDDQPENRLLITEYLYDLGLNIDEADCGEKCLELLKKKSYTLVLMDVQMPGLNGYEVLEEMRKDEKLAEVPVVFVSTVYDSDQHILKGISGGAIDFIAKPVNIDILKSKVSNFIKLYEKQAKLDQLVKRLEQMNQRLQENERKFKRITQSASDSIILLNENYMVRFWNQASSIIFGYGKYEIIAENFFDKLISPGSHKALFDYFDNIRNTPGNIFNKSIQLTGINKTGFEFPLELSLSYFNTADNKINYTIIIRDITLRLKIEKEALKAKELKETNKVMKEFMDNVSHELRTPMNAILGISKMLMKYNSENLLPKQIEGLQIINQSGTRLLDMVNDVLELSRIEADKVQIIKEPFELEKMLANLRSLVISLIDKKNIKFYISKSSDVPEIITADVRKLHQILINLLGNSVKFTNHGRINLFIHILENRLYFEVTDTGIGINEENLAIIFERFHQIDNSATKEYKGTGLGLNICKKLVELQGGQIWAESKPDLGTTMSFFIPVEIIAIPKPETNVLNENYISPEEQCKNIKNIDAPLAVIIDDNIENNFFYSNMLKENGYETICCYNSNTGFISVKSYIPDLIILKFEMPQIHGHFLINQLKSPLYLMKIPILIITSISELNLINIINPHRIIYEPINEKIMMKSIQEIEWKQHDKFPIANLIFYESENHLKDFFQPEDQIFFTEIEESAMLILSRRKVHNLIFDGMEPDGNNMKLIKWLSNNVELLPEKIILIYSDIPMSDIEVKLNSFSNYKKLSLKTIIKYNSFEMALNNI